MPRDILIVPHARNKLPADSLFTQRRYYALDPKVYPTEGIPKPVDTWIEKPMWGKVDIKNRFVYADVDSLLPIGNNISVINFVADAYRDMVSFVLNASLSLRTCMTSIVDVTSPVKGYEDLVSNYHGYFNEKLEIAFVDNYLSQQSKNEIKSFKDYMKLYLEFAKKNNTYPHTMTGLLSSANSSNRTSGLIIEFESQYRYDDDSQKWYHFLSSDFFKDYVRIAGLNGFYVNKNIPWSIAANLNSIYMKAKMKKYGIESAEENFNVNCIQSEYISYESFKKYMFYAYYSLITFQPKIEKLSVQNCIASKIFDSKFKTKRQVITRPTEFENVSTATFDEFVSIYPESYFIENYINLRLIESKINLSSKEKMSLMRQVVSEIKKSDTFDAMLVFSDYIAKRFTSPGLSRRDRASQDKVNETQPTPSQNNTLTY